MKKVNIIELFKTYEIMEGKYLGSGNNGDSFKMFIGDDREINIKFTKSKSEFECTKRLLIKQKRNRKLCDLTTEVMYCSKLTKKEINGIPKIVSKDFKHNPIYIIIKENVLFNDSIQKHNLKYLFEPILDFCSENNITSISDIVNNMVTYEKCIDFVKSNPNNTPHYLDIIDTLRIAKIYLDINANDLHSGNIGRDLRTDRIKAFDFDIQ